MERNEPAAPAADDGQGIPPDMLADQQPAGATEANPDSVKLARQIGWRPLEEYRGPKDKWIDADAFLEKVQTEAPVRNERLRTTAAENERLRRENADLKRERESGWGEILDRSRGAEQRGFQYAREQIDVQMDEAAQRGDMDAYKNFKRQRDELERLKPSAPDPRRADPKPGQPQQPDVATMGWIDQNPWFNTDPMLNGIAINIEGDLLRKQPNLSTSERLEKVKDEVQRRFPEKFGNPARTTPAAASRPSAQAARPPSREKKRTVADLDEHGKAALAKLKRQDPKLTDEMYLAAYKWDDKS